MTEANQRVDEQRLYLLACSKLTDEELARIDIWMNSDYQQQLEGQVCAHVVAYESMLIAKWDAADTWARGLGLYIAHLD